MSSFPFSLPTGGGVPTAHHRHQVSLEQILDFSVDPLTAAERLEADTVFNQLIIYCEPLQSNSPYMKATLVRLTYQHSRSKDTFLRQFFTYFDGAEAQNQPERSSSFQDGLSRFSGFDSQTSSLPLKRCAERAIYSFAEYLFQNFFLPMKTAGSKTPQPTPAALSAPPLENVVGTPVRLSTLRRDCLIRDHNRCVVTRAFNMSEVISREERDPVNAVDDDNQPLILEQIEFTELEVAHIIPHSIMSAKMVDGHLQLSESKKTAISILNMFDPGVVHLIEGPGIDRPANAISLTLNAHKRFGLFHFSFEALDGSHHPRHTYKIHSSKRAVSQSLKLPVIRTLFLSPNHTIDPPSERLLALHRAIAVVLELSAAGEYIDRIIRDMEELWVRSDGSVELGRIVSLRLGGWLDGIAA